MTRIAITGPGSRAEIDAQGAELASLQLAGRDVLWPGDPAWWAGRAPILFPMVCALPDDRYRLGGRYYDMPKHGFARQRTFEVAEQSAAAVTFRLEDDAATRHHWPFAFRLDLRFAAVPDGLETEAVLTNTGTDEMPVSFGFHPAFRWPLDGPRDAHLLRFAESEPAPIRRIAADQLLTDVEHPSPIDGDTLRLADELFADDAVILPGVVSRELVYGVPGRAGLRLTWRGLPDLGIWMKPGANYICLEPWAGFPAPHGFTDELWAKPGLLRVAPGASRTFAMTVSATTA